MTTVIATPLSQIKLAPSSAISISGLSWKAYEVLLQELGEDRPTRITYDQGVLEIRMPGEFHEVINRLLAKIITLLAIELGIEANDFGSVTLNRPDLNRGIEPDSCFYIQKAERGQGIDTNIAASLSPDLAVEVDIAHSSVGKMEIYRAIQVPEVWLYQRGTFKIQVLQGEQYVDVTYSHAFPMVSAQQLGQWIEMRKSETDLIVFRDVQRFCRNLTDKNML